MPFVRQSLRGEARISDKNASKNQGSYAIIFRSCISESLARIWCEVQPVTINTFTKLFIVSKTFNFLGSRDIRRLRSGLSQAHARKVPVEAQIVHMRSQNADACRAHMQVPLI